MCQSRPLRARRDASMANTAPTRPSQIAARSRSKPGRLTPETRTAKIVIDDRHIRPAESASPFREAILTSPALMIIGKLVSGGLPDVDEGTASQMVRRDLHRSPPPQR